MDGIDTIATWTMETERHVTDSALEWLCEEVQEEVAGGSVVGEENVLEKTRGGY
jgi:hypothetical protein